jgi:hypothetical protein
MPHKSTLRKPGLYTASTRTTARNNQIMPHLNPVPRHGKRDWVNL